LATNEVTVDNKLVNGRLYKKYKKIISNDFRRQNKIHFKNLTPKAFPDICNFIK
jgi:hypothetical protein